MLKIIRTCLTVLALGPLWAAGSQAFGDETCRKDTMSLVSFDTLIREADTIVLASPRTAEPALFSKDDQLNFIFDIEETLKGYARKPLKIKARLTDEAQDTSARDLDGHARMSFWDRMETRLVHVSSCAQSLDFKLGATYLLIDPDKNPEPLSVRFEMIAQTGNDRWLTSVRRMISDPGAAPWTLTLDQYIKAQQSAAFAMMPFCNEKLRAGASRVAEISQPLQGSRVDRDGLDPQVFARALEGCHGQTVLLGLFYQPDRSRPQDARPGATIYPAQRYVRLDEGTLHIDRFQTEVKIVGPETVTLSELITALKGT